MIVLKKIKDIEKNVVVIDGVAYKKVKNETYKIDRFELDCSLCDHKECNPKTLENCKAIYPKHYLKKLGKVIHHVNKNK